LMGVMARLGPGARSVSRASSPSARHASLSHTGGSIPSASPASLTIWLTAFPSFGRPLSPHLGRPRFPPAHRARFILSRPHLRHLRPAPPSIPPHSLPLPAALASPSTHRACFTLRRRARFPLSPPRLLPLRPAALAPPQPAALAFPSASRAPFPIRQLPVHPHRLAAFFPPASRTPSARRPPFPSARRPSSPPGLFRQRLCFLRGRRQFAELLLRCAARDQQHRPAQLGDPRRLVAP
jgi:hypothetical protein